MPKWVRGPVARGGIVVDLTAVVVKLFAALVGCVAGGVERIELHEIVIERHSTYQYYISSDDTISKQVSRRPRPHVPFTTYLDNYSFPAILV